MNKTLLIIVLIFFTGVQLYSQIGGVSINANGNPADPSAELDIQSTNKGLLIPRMTTAQRNTINSPALALQIFNTTTNCLEIYINSLWYSIFCGNPSPCGTSTVSFTYQGANVIYGTVVGQNNTCWLDRNLGASQAATAYGDVDAYGDLFQWGRLDDGHQLRNSNTTNILSSSDIPGHSSYILVSTGDYDWRSPQNNSLWQGQAGANNPCPVGWRLPIESELTDEIAVWNPQNNNGAFSSPLKLTIGGHRLATNGLIVNVNEGYLWSSTVSGAGANHLYASIISAGITGSVRGNGFSVRCIKD